MGESGHRRHGAPIGHRRCGERGNMIALGSRGSREGGLAPLRALELVGSEKAPRPLGRRVSACYGASFRKPEGNDRSVRIGPPEASAGPRNVNRCGGDPAEARRRLSLRRASANVRMAGPRSRDPLRRGDCLCRGFRAARKIQVYIVVAGAAARQRAIRSWRGWGISPGPTSRLGLRSAPSTPRSRCGVPTDLPREGSVA